MTNFKRLFFATHIKSEIILTDLLPALKQELQNEKISWIKPEQTHITVRFLGNISQTHIPFLEQIFHKAVSNSEPFQLQLCSVKTFGSRRRPTVIWIGTNYSEQMKQIHSVVEKELEAFGIKDDRETFIPHLTLARIKKLTDLKHFHKVIKKYANYQAETLTIDMFTLFESRLETTGTVHIPLIQYKLKSSLQRF